MPFKMLKYQAYKEFVIFLKWAANTDVVFKQVFFKCLWVARNYIE